MAMIDLVDKISSNIDHKNHNIGIFLDISAAFDTIDHNILLKKLQCYRIRGIACEWLKSYLSDRAQYVLTLLGGVCVRASVRAYVVWKGSSEDFSMCQLASMS